MKVILISDCLDLTLDMIIIIFFLFHSRLIFLYISSVLFSTYSESQFCVMIWDKDTDCAAVCHIKSFVHAVSSLWDSLNQYAFFYITITNIRNMRAVFKYANFII